MLTILLIILSTLQISVGHAADNKCLVPITEAGARKFTTENGMDLGADLALFENAKPLVDHGIFDVPIRDQKYAEICWSYALQEFASGLAFKETGNLIVTSADHSGFWNLYFQIFQHSAYFEKLAEKIRTGKMTREEAINEAVFMMRTRPGSLAAKKADFELDPGSDEPTALKQALVIGMVPDALFDRPISTQAKANNFTISLKDLVGKILQSPSRASMFGSTDADGINTPLYKLLTDDLNPYFKGSSTNNHLPYRPQETFDYNGKQYTSVQFMTDVMGFNPNDFGTVTATTENQELVYEAIQESITGANPTPVMMGFIVANQMKAEQEGIWSTLLFKGKSPEIDGGHEVLIGNARTDATGVIVGHVFQNSWNLQGLDSNGGQPASKALSGFNAVTMLYHRYFVSQGEGPDFVFRKTLLALPKYQGLKLETEGTHTTH